MKETHPPKKSSGPAFKALVRICGLIGIGAFFLPYFNGHTGLELIKELASKALSPGELFTAILRNDGAEPDSTLTYTLMSKVIGGVFLLGMIVFTIMSLWMTLSGRYAGGPLTMLLLFNAAAWVLVQFAGGKAGLDSTRFYMGHADIGYYVANAALFLPFIGMFFLDKSVQDK
jgi:hypothetical protein